MRSAKHQSVVSVEVEAAAVAEEVFVVAEEVTVADEGVVAEVAVMLAMEIGIVQSAITQILLDELSATNAENRSQEAVVAAAVDVMVVEVAIGEREILHLIRT